MENTSDYPTLLVYSGDKNNEHMFNTQESF